MKPSSAALTFVAITIIYVGVLLFLDLSSFSGVRDMLQLFPFLVTLAFCSFLLRYLRWYWLLWRAQCTIPFWEGYLCYLSGFAFTASPGKVGELVRVRYLLNHNVHPSVTISAFIYERALDLLVVLLIGSLVALVFDFFVWIAISIVLIIVAIIFVVRYPHFLRMIVFFLRRFGFKRLSILMRLFTKGIRGISRWLTFKDLAVSLILGATAWLIVSLSFVWLLNHIGEGLPIYTAISIYPVAMLVGALSMLPGGIGTTEAAITFQLVFYGVSTVMAGLLAICIRISTLWFAIICGMLSLIALELKSMPQKELPH
ncbi:lysylphosphatidylglycerol synthase transmembrane domain-containing protein [Cellvibrio sp. ARAG 10.3]|uniref:lysylphosphatidylglycerol synthase transmembrane domain-containing protein n=1 Tax=Cellvibrio sp. ARAG 10.3 TaxID=3451358 RepID=UPI003F48BE41